MPTWDSSLETGHPRIDADHREIFGQLKRLRTAIDSGEGRERTLELILVLQRYAHLHFALEEEYMRRVGCPAYKENVAAHAEFVAKLEGWLNVLTISGSPAAVLSDVHRDATAWIHGHIKSVDCQLRGCRLLEAGPAAIDTGKGSGS
jgi:hemerythrin